MSPSDNRTGKVTTAHQAKWAYVYVRQSSLSQVIQHGESTELQYRLVDRAVALGWPRERVKTIDADLGKSAASSDQRYGFQHLIAEISLARVGLVLSLDASRLARNNSDWHRLIELCGLFTTLIGDGEQLYDPRQYHDRLLLGLTGMMSEAELHQLKIRLHAGARQKAERGELHQNLPAGLERQRDGQVIFTADEEVPARLRLVFNQFDGLASAGAVMRYLQRHQLRLPTRPVSGPAPHEIVWQPATRERVLAILHNPAYAGAYVHGRTMSDARGVTQRPLEQWPICLPDIYPAYISWTHYLRNRQRLHANQSRYEVARQGVPRQGQALLQGLVICGRCGARMRLRYSGSHGQYPVYTCRDAHQAQDLPQCQEVRAIPLDAAVERHLLAALEPDKLALALAALKQLEQESETLQRQWQLRLERARYEAQRAQRQFQAVEPENRLVARTLERQWEEKLQAVEALEHDYQRWSGEQAFTLTESNRQQILALGEDLPKLWQAPTTTHADRKQILRLVIQSVDVDAKRRQGHLWYQLNWQTGATHENWLTRSVHGYREHPQQAALQRRVRELNGIPTIDAEIATVLNAEGFCTARGQAFSGNTVWLLRQQWQIPAVKTNGKEGNPLRWEDGSYSVEGLAKAVGVSLGTVYKWLHHGRVKGQQVSKAMPWKLLLTQTDITALQVHVKNARRTKRSLMEAS